MDTSVIHLQTQKFMQNTCWEQTGGPDRWKRICRTMQNSAGQRSLGENRSVSRTGPALRWWGYWMGAIVWIRREAFKSEELICGSLNGMRIRRSLLQSHIPWTGTQVPWKMQWLGAGVRDWGVISGQGLLLTAERWIEKMWGRRLWREKPVEESRAGMEARRYCGVTPRGWSHHHNLSVPTCYHQQLSNREAGPSNAGCAEPRVLV